MLADTHRFCGLPRKKQLFPELALRCAALLSRYPAILSQAPTLCVEKSRESDALIGHGACCVPNKKFETSGPRGCARLGLVGMDASEELTPESRVSGHPTASQSFARVSLHGYSYRNRHSYALL
ncbi:hypothetical protein CGCF413_v013293 [Colletotrichum fructicola]|nr:hypothetical protein CGCF413_v013293 [Colletotrichum fructicola]